MLRAALAGAILIALIACAASRISLDSVRTDATYSGGPFSRIAVLALFDSEAESRELAQNAAETLPTRGIDVLEGHRVPEPGRDYSQQEPERELGDAAVEGLLIFRLIAVDERSVYRPPTPYLDRIPRGVIVVEAAPALHRPVLLPSAYASGSRSSGLYDGLGVSPATLWSSAEYCALPSEDPRALSTKRW